MGEDLAEFRRFGELKVLEIEAWGDGATYEGKGFGILKTRREPATGFDHCLKDFSGVRVVPEQDSRVTFIFSNDMHKQRIAGIKMPDLIGLQTVKS